MSASLPSRQQIPPPRPRPSPTIRERLGSLQQQVARIREENVRYLEKDHHSYADGPLHKDRETRLRRILEELASLAKKFS